MSKEIVVNAEKNQTRIAIVEDGDLAELYFENPEHERTIGNIVLGRIRKVMPSIQAAFVNIGQDQDAFLHFSDVADNLPVQLELLKMDTPEVEKLPLPKSERASKRGTRKKPSDQKKGGSSKGGNSKNNGSKNGNSGKGRAAKNAEQRKGRRAVQKRYAKRQGKPPEKLLSRGQPVIVQISKEPIANKGSRISTDISLAGRFLVLVPMTEFIAVSKKITSQKERRRLKALAKSLLPSGFGAIVRTVAEGRDAKSLDTDLRLLMERWRRAEKKLSRKPRPPVVLHEDVDMVSSIIRDLFSSDYDRILIDNERLHRSIRSYVQAVAPQRADSVGHYTDDTPIFEAEGIRLDTERAFEKRVELASGGYLFIERTEAMHVVDVNSGRSGRGKSQEENSLHVNLEAARTTARQMRLRDLGGICVVDFIDMRSRKNRKKIYDALKDEFKKDRAVTKLLPMSDFGLVQITRQRLRPSITTTFGPQNGEASEDSSGADEGGNLREVRRLKSEVQRLKEDRRQLKSEHKADDRSSEEVERLKNKIERLTSTLDRARQKADRADATRKELEGKQRTAEQQQQPGTDQARPDDLVAAIERWIERFKQSGRRHAVALRVHPFFASYLHRQVPGHPTRWFMKHLVRIRIEPDADLSPLAFRCHDPRTDTDLTDALPADGAAADREEAGKAA